MSAQPAAATRCWRLARYAPHGAPAADCFELAAETPRPPGAGEVVVQTEWLSMDPFPRLAMRGEASLAPQLPLGSVMLGRGVGRVVDAGDSAFAAGDVVAGEVGWRERGCVPAAGLRKVDPALGPAELALGMLGPSGLTAYFCVDRHAAPKAGETVLVSAAAGSVGSVACQLAAMRGARVVGVVQGAEQAAFVRERLGAAAVVDAAAAGPLADAVRAACPDGVDAFLDGVGGELHDAALAAAGVGARIVVYGLISSYGEGAQHTDVGPRQLMRIVQRRLRIQGFLVGDHAAEFGAALARLAAWHGEGRLHAAQHVTHGFDSAPRAFAALFDNAPPGKQLLRL